MKECRKSRFLERVLTVIANLGALRGSSARDVLNYLLSSCADKSSSRNLTLQLQQALKQAVIAGLLKLQGGRYKICKSSDTTPASPQPKTDDEEKQKQKKRKKKKNKKKRKNSRRAREKRGGNSEASGAAAAAERRDGGGDDSRSSGHQTKSKKNPSAK